MALNIYAMEPNRLQEWLTAQANFDEGIVASKLEAKTLAELMAKKPIMSVTGDKAIISITGVLSKSGPTLFDRIFGYGGTAYSDVSEALQSALDDERVKSITLAINSPGGQVDGCDELCQEISAACKKKALAVENHGLIASAAYWLASAADVIVAVSPTAETGSIGVIIAGWDYSGADADAGVKRVVIVSKNAPDKDQSGYAGAGLEALQARVDALERIFIKRVATGRQVSEQTVINSFGKGSLLVADDPDDDKEDALSVGMIDMVVSGFQKTGNKSGVSAALISPAAESAGTRTEDQTMALKELMAENPAVAAEVEALLAAERDKATQAKAEQDAKITAATPFLDAKYPASIKALAASVIAGTMSVDALVAAATVYDSFMEDKAMAEAKDAQPAATPANTEKLDSKPGVISTDADIKADLAVMRF